MLGNINWIIILLLKFLITLVSIDSYNTYLISHISNLSKLYNKNTLFNKNNYVYALNNISTQFPIDKVIAFIGPSGSGKSTLGKCLVGIETIESDGGKIHFHSNCMQSSVTYLNQHYYLTYNNKDTINNILITSDLYRNHPCYTLLIDFVQKQIDSTSLTIPIQNLLVSYRITFEIILSILRIDSISNNQYVIVLDEYLDKELLSVRNKVMNNLKLLCINPSLIQLQIFIITHSKSVLVDNTDHAIVLYKGRIYDRGDSKLVKTPQQMTWI